MNKAEKLVSSEAVGANFIQLVEVNGNMYPVKPPTINRVAGAVACLSDLALNDGATIRDVLNTQENAREYARALSFMIQEDYELTEELAKGTYDEVVDALEAAFNMVSARSFSIAASLTKSASALVARSCR